MIFSLLEVDKPNKLKSLSKNKTSFLKKNEEVSLFHFNKLEDDFFHAVFNIRDEYQVSTEKLGEQHKFFYSSLVNFFFESDVNYVFLEYLNKEFEKIILEELSKRYKLKVDRTSLENVNFINIIKDLNCSIKSIDYTTENEEFLTENSLTLEDFKNISINNTIDKCTLLLGNQFLTVTKNGKVSVDNSDEEYLIRLIKELIHAI